LRAPVQQLNAVHASRSAARSHAGCVRVLNEDAVLDRPDIGLWAVADGMGGHNAGDVASKGVLEELASQDANIGERLQRANRRLLLHAAQTRSGPIGSTVVALEIRPPHYACFWVGDSRAYLMRDNRITRLTRDHSAVQELMDAGRITPAEAAEHPQSHVITRAVGAEQTLAVDSHDGSIEANDTFLLCSDGLSNLLREDELADVASLADLEAAADTLLALALRRQAPDNVSVILIRPQSTGAMVP
jgi:serine/threonine protein phosphatase PrpC